jgi:hypothetical protein
MRLQRLYGDASEHPLRLRLLDEINVCEMGDREIDVYATHIRDASEHPLSLRLLDETNVRNLQSSSSEDEQRDN